jgi:hypothetical protein
MESHDPRIIVWAWAALESDFERFYRLDLAREVFDGGMTARRLMVLIRGLPADSSFAWWLKDTTNRDFATFDPTNVGSSMEGYALDNMTDN